MLVRFGVGRQPHNLWDANPFRVCAEQRERHRSQARQIRRSKFRSPAQMISSSSMTGSAASSRGAVPLPDISSFHAR